MISFLEGSVAGKTHTSALINVSGVGFELGMSQTSLSHLPAPGENVLVHTYLQVRDDAMLLFGFLSLEEKALFEQLISVSGVGPKVALAALSFYEPKQLAAAIAAQDIAAVQKIPGVGKKMASRIILELKGSLDVDALSLFEGEHASVSAVLEGVREALLSMGFTSAEIELAVKDAPLDASESVLLQYALKKLGS